MSFQQSPKKLPSLNVNTSSMSTQSGLSRGSLNEVKPCALVLYPNGQDAMGPRASPKSIPSIKITKFQKGLFGEVTVSGTAKKSVGYIQSPLNVNSPFVVNYGGLLSPQNRLSINGVKPESFSTDKQQSTNDITASSNRRSAKVQSLIQPKLQHSPPLAPTNSVFEKSGTLPTSGTNLLSPVYKQAMGRTIMRVERLIKKQCQNIVKLTEKKGSDVEVAPNLKMIAPQNTQKFTLSGISSIQNIDTSILQEASILENNSPVNPVQTQESHVHWINESLIRRGPSRREKEESEGTICQDISSSRDTREQLKEHMNLLDSSISTCSSHSVTEQASVLDFEFDKQKQITKIPLEKIDRRFSEHINNSVRRMSGGIGSDFRFITEEDWNKKSPKGDGLYVDSEILTPVEQKENSMRLSKGKNINNILTPEITNPWNSPKIPSNKILVRIIKSIKHLPDTREQNALHAISQESPKKLYTMISHKQELSKNSILADQHKTLNNEDGLKKLREIKKINLANIHNQKPRAPIRQIL